MAISIDWDDLSILDWVIVTLPLFIISFLVVYIIQERRKEAISIGESNPNRPFLVLPSTFASTPINPSPTTSHPDNVGANITSIDTPAALPSGILI
jgi:hypothetical protein